MPYWHPPFQPSVVVLLCASFRRVFFELSFALFCHVFALPKLSNDALFALLPVGYCSCTPLESFPPRFEGQVPIGSYSLSPFAKVLFPRLRLAWIPMVNPCFSRCFSIPIFHDFSRSAPRFGWLSICHDFDCFCILTIPCTCPTCNFVYRDHACVGFRPH